MFHASRLVPEPMPGSGPDVLLRTVLQIIRAVPQPGYEK